MPVACPASLSSVQTTMASPVSVMASSGPYAWAAPSLSMPGAPQLPLLAVKRAACTSLRVVGRSNHTAIALPAASARRRGDPIRIPLVTMRVGGDQAAPSLRLAHNELLVEVS